MWGQLWYFLQTSSPEGGGSGSAAAENTNEGLELSGSSHHTVSRWRSSSCLKASTSSSREESKKPSPCKALHFYFVREALPSKSPVICHRHSPVWENLVLWFPSSKIRRGREKVDEHGCRIEQFVVCAMCFSSPCQNLTLSVVAVPHCPTCFHGAA